MLRMGSLAQLMAAAMLSLVSGLVSADTRLVWTCPSTPEGDFSPLFRSPTEQWFDVVEEQASCQQACTSAVNQSKFSAKIKKRGLEQAVAECLSEHTANLLAIWRETMIVGREKRLGTVGANDLTKSGLQQKAACVEALATCEQVYIASAAHDPSDRMKCWSECGAAVAACNKDVSHVDTSGVDSVFKGYKDDARDFFEGCRKGYIDSSISGPPSPNISL